MGDSERWDQDFAIAVDVLSDFFAFLLGVGFSTLKVGAIWNVFWNCAIVLWRMEWFGVQRSDCCKGGGERTD